MSQNCSSLVLKLQHVTMTSLLEKKTGLSTSTWIDQSE